MNLQLSLAFLSGACFVLGPLLLIGFVGADPYIDRPLPVSLRTLFHWGELPKTFVLHRPKPLPRRVPGATTLPEPAPLHTNEPADYVSPSRWVPRWLWHWWLGKINEISILESDEAFAKWWEDEWSPKRVYVARHRYADRVEDSKWREDHARIPTAEWPTLATSGYAAEIIALDVRPMICAGPRLPNGLSPLLKIERSSSPSTCSSDSSSSELAYVT